MSGPTIPPLMPASAPLPPERVQFTMRTFFAAAAWLAIGCWGQATLILVEGSGFYGDIFLLWWAGWVWAGLWSIVGILRSHACRIAMLLGFLVVVAELLAADLIAYLTPSFRRVVLDEFSCNNCTPLSCLRVAMSLRWGLGLSMAFVWGVHLGILVGIGRAVAGAAKAVLRKVWQARRGGKLADADKPRLQRWTMAGLMAGVHLIVSMVLLMSTWALIHPSNLANTANLQSLGMPKTLPPPDIFLWNRAGRCFVIGTLVHEMPIFLPAECLRWYSLVPGVLDPMYIRSILRATLYYNLIGVSFYFALGWLIGWRLDRRTARLRARQAEAVKPSAEEESSEESPGSSLPLREG